ncbi:VOC family protein [Actinomadura rubrisoli]|uniref:VOC domain-containing protein n=1 Tax=Actinomadura rubrisoli TaxID=2530368 RepID=A0A4R5C8L0_9ACTN|nr:VOC family protein [Actinomadura rubrisoli]TDD93332.1 hypothetical protein E1298_10125 [Actinomadura rubrisoli]
MSEPYKGIAYLELYVDDGPAVVKYYVRGLLFERVAVAYDRMQRSVLLRSHDAQVVITTPARAGGPVADYLARHGDGVADIALYQQDLGATLARANLTGMRVLPGPAPATTLQDVQLARIAGAGSVHHTLIQPTGTSFDGMPPGFCWDTDTVYEAAPDRAARPRGIDHLTWCLPAGELEAVVSQYRRTFEMEIIGSNQIVAGATAANSHVLRDSAGVTHVMLETDRFLQPHGGGQIEAFIARHGRGGIQHVAWSTNDLLAAIRRFTVGGVRFLDPPGAYYDALPERLAAHPVIGDQLSNLHESGVLVDHDHSGLLYQIFTRSPHRGDALFYELIQRGPGTTGFGSATFRALLEAQEAAASRPAPRTATDQPSTPAS